MIWKVDARGLNRHMPSATSGGLKYNILKIIDIDARIGSRGISANWIELDDRFVYGIIWVPFLRLGKNEIQGYVDLWGETTIYDLVIVFGMWLVGMDMRNQVNCLKSMIDLRSDQSTWLKSGIAVSVTLPVSVHDWTSTVWSILVYHGMPERTMILLGMWAAVLAIWFGLVLLTTRFWQLLKTGEPNPRWKIKNILYICWTKLDHLIWAGLCTGWWLDW